MTAAADLLLAIAQIAVALAGFSGLVAAIRTASPEGWHPRDIWSLSWMLGASIGALVLGLLPLWLALFGWSEEVVFRVSSAAASVYIGTFLGVMAWTGRRLTLKGYPPRVAYFPSLVALLLVVPLVGVVAGAAGWLRDSMVPAYVASLLALLVASVLVLAVYLVLLAQHARQSR